MSGKKRRSKRIKSASKTPAKLTQPLVDKRNQEDAEDRPRLSKRSVSFNQDIVIKEYKAKDCPKSLIELDENVVPDDEMSTGTSYKVTTPTVPRKRRVSSMALDQSPSLIPCMGDLDDQEVPGTLEQDDCGSNMSHPRDSSCSSQLLSPERDSTNKSEKTTPLHTKLKALSINVETMPRVDSFSMCSPAVQVINIAHNETMVEDTGGYVNNDGPTRRESVASHNVIQQFATVANADKSLYLEREYLEQQQVVGEGGAESMEGAWPDSTQHGAMDTSTHELVQPSTSDDTATTGDMAVEPIATDTSVKPLGDDDSTETLVDSATTESTGASVQPLASIDATSDTVTGQKSSGNIEVESSADNHTSATTIHSTVMDDLKMLLKRYETVHSATGLLLSPDHAHCSIDDNTFEPENFEKLPKDVAFHSFLNKLHIELTACVCVLRCMVDTVLLKKVEDSLSTYDLSHLPTCNTSTLYRHLTEEEKWEWLFETGNGFVKPSRTILKEYLKSIEPELGWFIRLWSEDCVLIDIKHKITAKLTTHREEFTTAAIPCQKVRVLEYTPIQEGASYSHLGSVPYTVLEMPLVIIKVLKYMK